MGKSGKRTSVGRKGGKRVGQLRYLGRSEVDPATGVLGAVPLKPSVLEWDDKRVQRIMKYLWGSWWIDSLEGKIARAFPAGEAATVRAVAQEICDLHCGGMGYGPDEITSRLDRLLPPAEVVPVDEE